MILSCFLFFDNCEFFLDYEQIYRTTAATFPYSSSNISGSVFPTSTSPFYTPNLFDVNNVYL